MSSFWTEQAIEVFAVVAASARLFRRIPLITRYVWSSLSSPWPATPYAKQRFGPRYKWRPWLLFDAKELEMLDDLINFGTNEEIWIMRDSQIGACNMAAVIGALTAQAAITALQLPLLEEVHYMARGSLSISLVVSLLAVFFAWLQHRVYSFIKNPATMRAWLSNGVKHQQPSEGRKWQSSSFSHQALQVPFELVSISITLFFTGIGVYFGSAMTNELKLSAGSVRQANQGIFITFLITIILVFSLFGQLIGGKDIERARCDTLEVPQQKNETGTSRSVFHTVSHGLIPQPGSPVPTAQTTVEEPSSVAAESSEVDMVVALQKVAEAHQACAAANAELAALYKRPHGK